MIKVRNEKSLNILISNADKTKTKKFCGFVEKRFIEELKKLENMLQFSPLESRLT